VYIIKGRTTRDADLEYLEERRDRGELDGRRLDAIYRQTKDEQLERLRGNLIEAHKRADHAAIERISKLIYQRTGGR